MADSPSGVPARTAGNDAHDGPPQSQSPRHQSDERSPLLAGDPEIAQRARVNTDWQDSQGDDYHSTKSVWYLILLTISIGGLQIAWSVEISNGSPYLLSLGLSKSLMALVWIAGPLTGTLVQPYVGMLSDNCRLPWGRRKPFMVGGAAFTIVSLLFLAWVKELVTGLLGIFGAHAGSEGVRLATIVAAVIGVYVLDFAINTVQAAIRAFIVDCCPPHQQEAANAMASRVVGFGNIIGYVAGYANLPDYLWFFGDTQFKILCAIASFALAVTIAASVTFIHERDPRLDAPRRAGHTGILSFFVSLFKSIKGLPPQIWRVCQVQFVAWVGFFPLLFYTSSYIGEIYAERYLEENPNMTPDELQELYDRATRIGSFALLVNAIVSLATNVFLPFFIAPTYDNQLVFGEESGAGHDMRGSRKRSGISRLLEKLQIPGLTLRRAWFLSLVMFGLAMFCTVIIRSVESATALIGLVGITWGLTQWAPYAIISAEISARNAFSRAKKRGNPQAAPASRGHDQHDLSSSVAATDEHDGEDQAGVILGIHNMAIAAPQIIATIGSSIIFKIWQKPRGETGDPSMSIVFALGGVFVLIASVFITKMRDGGPTHADMAGEAEEQR